MYDGKIIEMVAAARNLTFGVNGRLLHETLNGGDVLFSILFGQRSPVSRLVFNFVGVKLIGQGSNHSRRYTMFSEVQPDLRVLMVASI